jgi:ubiquinone/menaquinone biosynthesis C-methylase UbiE
MDDRMYQKVIEANIAVHTRVSKDYDTCEPHFRPENVSKVEDILKSLFKETKATRMLDLGCGTGFMIHIAKKYLQEIDGVDVTQAMMDRVDKSGPCKITLHNSDTGAFPVKEGSYDVVTGYSFLHHLFDITPTLKTAYKGLKPGGKFYADLDPNFYFWESINSLKRHGNYDPIVDREIEMVTYKDEDIEKTFGVSKDTFNHAEYSKNIKGGFKEEELQDKLRAVGFKDVRITYYWFLGQAFLINQAGFTKEDGLKYSSVMSGILEKSLPVSRNLFKYMGFVATK